jgi:predicted metal-dependent enzyme (double-stranded beta helix superfamily)
MGGADEYFVESPTLREFIGRVKAILAENPSPAEALGRLREPFSRLLTDPDWLPEAYRQPCETGGMGSNIGNWLLYRSGDGSLSLFSLVVPPGAATPVHDHLAWGLVGLYAGEQEELVYRVAETAGDGRVRLELTQVNRLKPGDFYELVPPDNDIHTVRTVSAEPSVSIHLLTRDIGCIWRHAYEPETGAVKPFRSGYTNAVCEAEG